MSFGRGGNGDTSHFWVGEDLVYRVSESCRRIRRGKLGTPEWIRFTDPREDTEISKVSNQVLSPIAGTNTSDFVSDHHCHALLLITSTFMLLISRERDFP